MLVMVAFFLDGVALTPSLLLVNLFIFVWRAKDIEYPLFKDMLCATVVCKEDLVFQPYVCM
jgi:hypothetical protein